MKHGAQDRPYERLGYVKVMIEEGSNHADGAC